jgi:LemA protein
MRGNVNIFLIVLVLVVAGVVGWWVATYNQLVRLHEQIPAAWAQVENVLERRNDLIPNLVATVKGYAKHEETVFKDIAMARAALAGAHTLSDRVEANNNMSGALARLLVVAENYPNLKADQNFIRLQDELAGTENRIAVERKRFNEMVQQYNTEVKTFPTKIIARYAGLSPEETYFKAIESAKTVPQVSF